VASPSPRSRGLTLDAAGWASTEAVVAALRERLGASAEDLGRVVALNDKQRFELSADGERIRARQGHSVEVQGAWTPADPPERLFHGTAQATLDAILRQGLRPMQRHHVHLSPDAETARRVGARRGAPVVLEVQAARLAAAGEPFFLSANGVWLTAHVPPEFLRRI
jgi:putative RNA 2'-phosphotransferase